MQPLTWPTALSIIFTIFIINTINYDQINQRVTLFVTVDKIFNDCVCFTVL